MYSDLHIMAFTICYSLEDSILCYSMFVIQLFIINSSFFVNMDFLYCVNIKTSSSKMQNLYNKFNFAKIVTIL